MKIFCIGRNYAEHAKELNNAIPEKPVVFMKPATALLKDNKDFYYPAFSNSIHYEGEMVLKINKAGKHIESAFASKYFDEITIGIDFTARDLQSECKAKGLPWEIAKAFDHAAPIGTFVHKTAISDLTNLKFELHKNGHPVQQGNTKDLMFAFDELIVYISRFFTLSQGDLIFTGTPAGVGEVQVGDLLEGFVEGQKLLNCAIK